MADQSCLALWSDKRGSAILGWHTACVGRKGGPGAEHLHSGAGAAWWEVCWRPQAWSWHPLQVWLEHSTAGSPCWPVCLRQSDWHPGHPSVCVSAAGPGECSTWVPSCKKFHSWRSGGTPGCAHDHTQPAGAVWGRCQEGGAGLLHVPGSVAPEVAWCWRSCPLLRLHFFMCYSSPSCCCWRAKSGTPRHITPPESICPSSTCTINDVL